MGPARLRVAVRPPGDGDVAARDGGGPRDAAGRSAGGVTVILAPWQADGAHVDPRRPYRVDVGGGATSRPCSTTGSCPRPSRSSPPPPPMPTGSPASGWRATARRIPCGWRRPTLVIATDGELYGHHQSFRDLFLQRLVAPEGGPLVRRGRLPRGDRRARRPSAPRDPDPGPDLVELPPRRPALDRRVPGRPGRPLEGLLRGARTARRRDRQRDGCDRR